MPVKKPAKKAAKQQPKPAKTRKTAKTSAGYDAKNIQVLEGLEAVRRRPGMYIGTTGERGLHHLIWEVVDNSIDEAMAGFCTEITVRLLPGGRVMVSDDGRGIPVDIHPQYKTSALELVLTKLHAGGKFGGGGYKVSGGLHGVGISVVNALSTFVRATVRRSGKIWVQEYARGKPKKKVAAVGKTTESGTSIEFEPDSSIFETTVFCWQTILDHLRQQAYLTKGIRIIVVDDRPEKERTPDKTAVLDATGNTYTFYFEGGIASYVAHINHTKEAKHEHVFYLDKTAEDDVRVEVALQYTDEYNETLFAFTNNIYNTDGGTHVAGFRSALTRSLNNFARTKSILKEKDANLSGEDVREGLTAIISVKVKEPQFEGQTKSKLGNTEVRSAVDALLYEGLLIFLEEHPREAEGIIGKCLLAARARAAAKVARESVLRKGALEGFTLPGKLADCSSKNAAVSELFLVEGDSAGGCFSGDTKIALLDGRNVPFTELLKEYQEGKTNYCYTIDDDGLVAVGDIRDVRITKRNAEVITIILDNDEKITCTPDHKFMINDGTYKAAQNLTPNDSLMPLYRKHSQIGKKITIEGYEMVYQPQKNYYQFTHLLSDEYNLARYIYKEETYNKTYRQHGLAALKKLYDRYGRIDEKRYNEYRKQTNDTTLLKLETIRTRFFGGNEQKLKEAVANFNHKIKRIERVRRRIDVYDIEVPGTHNFALASGVFVHNSAKSGRDREHQAILPLRGKILNVERARLDKILTNNELKSLIIALGTNVGEQFEIEKLRYHRVIIMTDADVDGAHIRTLLLTLFYRHFPELLTAGHVYIAQPPLYSIRFGKTMEYAYSEEEKEEILNKLQKGHAENKQEAAKTKSAPQEETESTQEEAEQNAEEETESVKIGGIRVNIQRYKGLGEMNPEQLWETTMDPQARTLKRVTVEDAARADEIFDILMGAEVAPRKKFIQTHAKKVRNLDI